MDIAKREQILITVLTYPMPSAKYIKTICTGGITDHQEWRRLYPVPLRYLQGAQRYHTYDVIEVDLTKGKDNRPETRTPNVPTLKVVDKINGWDPRCQWVNPTIFPSLEAMKAAGSTIGPVAVQEVVDLLAKESAHDWKPEQKEKLRQAQLFDEQKPLEKIPWEFRFIWKDSDGVEHNSLILEWEMCQTWRQYRHRYSDPIQRIRDK